MPLANATRAAKGYRTLAVNVAGIVIAFAVSRGWITDDPGTREAATEIILFALASANVYLRTITDTPIGQKHPRPAKNTN